MEALRVQIDDLQWEVNRLTAEKLREDNRVASELKEIGELDAKLEEHERRETGGERSRAAEDGDRALPCESARSGKRGKPD